MSRHDRRFPNEPDDYREARDELLEHELALRDQLERVAAARRSLPVGGPIPDDYCFTRLGPDGKPDTVALSQLFTPTIDSLVLYSFMYGPDMAEACPMCTSMLDGLDGNAPHIRERVNMGVVAKSPIERIAAHADARGWSRLPLLSSAGTTYNADYHAETPDGSQLPAINVFVRRLDGIHHFWNAEILYADIPGHPRHVDLLWPLWNVLDLTPEGRGKDWFPQLSY